MEKQKPSSAPRLPFRRTVDPKLQGELIELAFLHGRDKLAGHDAVSLLVYE